jgi:hypothetical protein
MADKQQATSGNNNSKQPPKNKPDGRRVGSNNTNKGIGNKQKGK